MTPQERKELYKHLKKLGIDTALEHKHNEYIQEGKDEVSRTGDSSNGEGISP